jgi:predicted exporter
MAREHDHIAWRMLAIVVLLVAIAVCAARWRVTTAITDFVTDARGGVRGELAATMAESEPARTMVFAIGSDDLDAALAAAEQLATRLRAEPEVAWARDRIDPAIEDAIVSTYFPRRLALAGDDQAELERRLSDAGLAQSAAALARELAKPTAPAIKRIAPDDPWSFFRGRLDRLAALRTGALELVDGRFVAADRGHAFVLAATRHSPFATAMHRELARAIDAEIAAVERDHGVTVERSAIHRFALAGETEVRRDIAWIGAASIVGVVLLFAASFRSLRLLAIAIVPLAAAFAVATAAVLAVHGRIHGLTFAFGGTLIGVCVDYPVHLYSHHAAALRGTSASATLRAVWPGLALGAATTAAAFAALAFAELPGLRQIGLFAAVGATTALVVTRLWVVPLLGPAQPRPLAGARVRLLPRLPALARAGAIAAVAAAAIGAVGLPRLHWADDARALDRRREDLLAEDERVRALVGRVDSGRVVVAEGDDLEQALRTNDRVHARLRTSGLQFRSLHALLPSLQLQRENLATVRASPQLAERTIDALVAAGFRREPFARLPQVIAEEPPPLTLDDLRGTSLEPLVSPFVVELPDRVAILTFVDGAADEHDAVARALDGLDRAFVFDQSRFLAEAWAAFRGHLLPLLGWGALAVAGLLALRYRSARATIAALAPALLACAATLGVLGLAGAPANVLHLCGLLLVIGMGVDYGVFVAEARGAPERVATSLTGVLVACASTVMSFGALAVSSHPALRAIGATAAIGVTLSAVLAPLALLLAPARPEAR